MRPETAAVPLAVSSYGELGSLADGEGRLNLAWTLDERDYLAADLQSVIALELEDEVRERLAYVNSYFVQDPYGEHVLGPAIRSFFSIDDRPCSVTCGAGVIALLHSLARLTQRRVAHVVGDTYPDFPFWVERAEGECVAGSAAAAVEEHVEAARRLDAVVVFLERPSLLGDRLADLSEVRALCEGVAAFGALVVVDESNGNYYPPDFSAVTAVHELENLVVVRGLSKAYSLGGLRLGYCVASDVLQPTIRAAVPPLLASSLSIRIGKKVLELGDVAEPLRARIGTCKQEAAELFEAAGLGEIVLSSQHLPYVLLAGTPEAARERVEARGVLGKLHPLWPERTPGRALYRLSAPLRDDRMSLLRQKLGRAAGV